MNAMARVAATAWLLAGLSACGGDDIVTSGPTDVTANVVQDTAAITEPIDAGTSFLQETISSSGDGLVVDIAATGEDGSVPPDGGLFGPDVSNDCPGGAGCACKDHGQCDTAICIEVAGQKKCAQKCVDTCPKGFQCVPAGSGDVIHICAPLLNWLCDPCTSSSACQGIGLDNAACVDYGDQGAFCGIPCDADTACPEGQGCLETTSIEGVKGKQCVRLATGGKAGLGTCPCSATAIAAQLSTGCAIASKDDKGQVVGKCPGKRTCGVAGLGDCIGPPPGAEVCDGSDNDCDGKTDEDTCDDGNPCTADGCDPKNTAPGQTGCVHNKIDGPCDADGSVCTVKDSCIAGVCTPGKYKNCADGNACTKDDCDKSKGCVNDTDDSVLCDDNNLCTAVGTCAKGQCKSGPAVQCPNSTVCVIGQCDLVTGKCAFKKLSAACNDGNACTQKDTCDDGFCLGKAVDCDDTNPCTSDSCSKLTGCTHKTNQAPCDDANKCTVGDSCKAGVCVGLAGQATVTCDDGNPCSTDSCNPAKGCLHAANQQACSDGNPCTVGDQCAATQCLSGTNVCSCQSSADCAVKEDGDLCNGTLYCDKSKAPFSCKINPATVVSCSKSKDTPCLANQCQAKSGKCQLAAIGEGLGCDADGSVCTQADSCQSGLCVAGKKVSCEDGNPCTTDSCSAKAGCQHTAHTGSCDDGDACTQGDVCKQKVCFGGKPKVCDDANKCTKDSCDKAKGCVQAVQLGKAFACYSGKDGTKGVGTCQGGLRTCQAGGVLGACKGEIVAAAKEACDGKDDDCDGKTDIGCLPVDFRVGFGGAFVSGQAGAFGVRALAGGEAIAGQTGGAGKHNASFGAYAWLRALIGP